MTDSASASILADARTGIALAAVHRRLPASPPARLHGSPHSAQARSGERMFAQARDGHDPLDIHFLESLHA